MVTEDSGDCQIDIELESHTTIDSNIFGHENGNGDSEFNSSKETTPTPTPSIDSMTAAWVQEYPASKIVVAEFNKLAGLGISLEGTVDVEDGIEKRPHHFIRSILDDGPVGLLVSIISMLLLTSVVVSGDLTICKKCFSGDWCFN